MILLYHNLVPPSAPDGYRLTSLTLRAEVFARHLQWLSAHFSVVSLEEYLEAPSPSSRRFRKKTVALTFDDGTATSFACAFPLLQDLQIPATFFVTTCHVEQGELMTGCYLNAVFYETLYSEICLPQRVFPLSNPFARQKARQTVGELARASGDPVGFTRQLAQAYPLPPEIRALYQGMSHEQLRLAGQSALIEIGAHTVTHPYLTDLSQDAQAQEIIHSKQVLENLTGQPVRYFAYPSGDYNPTTLALMKQAGFEAAFATIPRHLGNDPRFELPRVGIYSDSLLKLHLKATDIADKLRKVGWQVG